eukprot:9083083-Pyramimonas_sp.AAC.1
MERGTHPHAAAARRPCLSHCASDQPARCSSGHRVPTALPSVKMRPVRYPEAGRRYQRSGSPSGSRLGIAWSSAGRGTCRTSRRSCLLQPEPPLRAEGARVRPRPCGRPRDHRIRKACARACQERPCT